MLARGYAKMLLTTHSSSAAALAFTLHMLYPLATRVWCPEPGRGKLLCGE